MADVWTEAMRQEVLTLLTTMSASKTAEFMSKKYRQTVTRSQILGISFRHKSKTQSVKPRVRSDERGQDWTIVRALRLRTKGYPWDSVSKTLGLPAYRLREQCQAVAREDIATGDAKPADYRLVLKE